MSIKKLWIYLAVLLVVGGIWGLTEIFFPKKTEEVKNPLLFPNLNPAKITEVQWQRGTETVHLKKNPGWMIFKPISVQADRQVIDGILQTLTTLRPEGKFSASTKDLTEFGLTDPKLRLLFFSEGKWTEIQLGERNAVGNARYGKVANSSELFLVGNFILKELDRDLLALRDKRVFSFELKQIQSLEIRGDKKTFTLEKDSKGWRVKDSPEKRVNKNRVEAFISDLLWLQAKEFAESDSEDQSRGLNTSKIRIKLCSQGKESKEETLLLGKEEPGKGLWAKSPLHQELILIEPSLVKKIPKGPEEWEEKALPSGTKKGP